MMTTAIWITLIILSIFFIYVLSKDVIKHQKVLENVSVVKTALIGFVVNFFDVLDGRFFLLGYKKKSCSHFFFFSPLGPPE